MKTLTTLIGMLCLFCFAATAQHALYARIQHFDTSQLAHLRRNASVWNFTGLSLFSQDTLRLSPTHGIVRHSHSCSALPAFTRLIKAHGHRKIPLPTDSSLSFDGKIPLLLHTLSDTLCQLPLQVGNTIQYLRDAQLCSYSGHLTGLPHTIFSRAAPALSMATYIQEEVKALGTLKLPAATYTAYCIERKHYQLWKEANILSPNPKGELIRRDYTWIDAYEGRLLMYVNVPAGKSAEIIYFYSPANGTVPPSANLRIEYAHGAAALATDNAYSGTATLTLTDMRGATLLNTPLQMHNGKAQLPPLPRATAGAVYIITLTLPHAVLQAPYYITE